MAILPPPMEIGEDPFEVLNTPPPVKSNVNLDPVYSDISDDDFDIPCSQKGHTSEKVSFHLFLYQHILNYLHF